MKEPRNKTSQRLGQSQRAAWTGSVRAHIRMPPMIAPMKWGRNVSLTSVRREDTEGRLKSHSHAEGIGTRSKSWNAEQLALVAAVLLEGLETCPPV